MDKRTHHVMLSSAQRKELLIEQGAMHRLAIAESKRALKAGVRPAALTGLAAGKLTQIAANLFKAKSKAGMPVGGISALPLLWKGASLLAKSTASRPALRKVLIAGVVGTAVALLAKRKWTQWRAGNRDDS